MKYSYLTISLLILGVQLGYSEKHQKNKLNVSEEVFIENLFIIQNGASTVHLEDNQSLMNLFSFLKVEEIPKIKKEEDQFKKGQLIAQAARKFGIHNFLLLMSHRDPYPKKFHNHARSYILIDNPSKDLKDQIKGFNLMMSMRATLKRHNKSQ